MNVMLRGVYVRDDPVDYLVGVGNQFHVVAAENGHVPQPFSQLDRTHNIGIQLRTNDVGVSTKTILEYSKFFLQAGVFPDAEIGQAVSSDQQVEQKTQPGHEKNHRQPRQRRTRSAMAYDHEQHDQPNHPLTEIQGH